MQYEYYRKGFSRIEREIYRTIEMDWISTSHMFLLS